MLTRTTDTIHPLKMHDGQRVQVEHFALDSTQLPKTDDWYKGWNVDLSKGLAQAISTKLNSAGFQATDVSKADPTNADYTIKGRYVQIAAGSKAGRGVSEAFGGYSGDAGKAYLIIEGTLVDRSGREVMTFYNKEVPPQNWTTDSTGAFSSAISKNA